MMSWAKIKGVFILSRRNVARVIAALAAAILAFHTAAAHDAQCAVRDGRGDYLISALRPCGKRLRRFPFNPIRRRHADGEQDY